MSNEIVVRPASPADVPALLEIYAPYVEKTAISFEYTVPTQEEFALRLKGIAKKYPYLVAETEAGILGYAYAAPFKARAAYDWAVETTVYVSQSSRRSGVGRRLYEALESALKLQGVLNMNACIALPVGQDEFLSADSVEFHKHMGFRRAAHFHLCGYKFGRWYDMVWMEKLIGRAGENQPPVLPFNSVKSGLFPEE